MMKWYKFASKETFDIWHESVKNELGYPLPSYDLDGNILGEPYTTEYTSVVKVSENDWRTISDPIYAEGLEPSEEPVTIDEREIL